MATRCIRYDFGASFLRFVLLHFVACPCTLSIRPSRKSIGAKLVFKVGEDPLPGFRMIERHYFKDQLIKSFDFTLGFCMFVVIHAQRHCLAILLFSFRNFSLLIAS